MSTCVNNFTNLTWCCKPYCVHTGMSLHEPYGGKCYYYSITMCKSDLFDKIERDFFQAVPMLVQLYGCTKWTLVKCLEKKLEGNYTRIPHSILNNSLKQHSTNHAMTYPYGHNQMSQPMQRCARMYTIRCSINSPPSPQVVVLFCQLCMLHDWELAWTTSQIRFREVRQNAQRMHSDAYSY